MLTLRLKDSIATQWAAKLNEQMAIAWARQNWFAACAGAAGMSKQDIVYWYQKTVTTLEVQVRAWKYHLEMHDFNFPNTLEELAEVSTTSIHTYTNALTATCPLLQTRRKLLYLIMDRKVAGLYLKQVYVTESVVKDLLQNDGQGRLSFSENAWASIA
jgi:hypothetical protein